MNLEQFAKKAGVTIVATDPEFGEGAVGYRTKDHPNCTCSGFKTEKQAYESWLLDEFGKQLASAIKSLLRQTEKKAAKTIPVEDKK